MTTGQVFTANGSNQGAWATPTGSIATFIANLTTSPTNVTGDGTEYPIIFDAALKNVGGAYNASTGVFTAPVTGNYMFVFSAQFSGIVAQTSVFLDIVATSRTFRGNVSSPAGLVIGGAVQMQMSAIVDMTASDTVSFKAASGGSTKTVGITGNASSLCVTYVSGYFIG